MARIIVIKLPENPRTLVLGGVKKTQQVKTPRNHKKTTTITIDIPTVIRYTKYVVVKYNRK